MDKRLYIVSAGKRELCIVAGYRDEVLFVQSVKESRVRTPADCSKFIANMQLYKNKGFLVAVNETIPRFAAGFNRSNLADVDLNGQPRLVAALTAYQYLSNRNGIHFNPGIRSISVPQNVYDKQVDDKGVVSYRIDWDSISEDALALLVTVYNCFNHSVTEEGYLKSLFGELNKRRNTKRVFKGRL